MLPPEVLLALIILATIVSAICLLLSLFRVSFSLPGWVVWAILTLYGLILWLGR